MLGFKARFGKFHTTLNNTFFGAVTWQHATNPELDQTFDGRIISDLIVGYSIKNRASINLTINNLLNIYPEEIDAGEDFLTDLGGRFRYPWEVNQFGFLGTVIKFGGSVQF